MVLMYFASLTCSVYCLVNDELISSKTISTHSCCEKNVPNEKGSSNCQQSHLTISGLCGQFYSSYSIESHLSSITLLESIDSYQFFYPNIKHESILHNAFDSGPPLGGVDLCIYKSSFQI